MRKKINNKQLSLLISLLLVLAVSVGGTLAYIVTQTGAVTNTFEPAKVTCKIQDTMAEGDTVKKDAVVINTGDVDAYIRAAIIVTWRDADGNIAPEKPVENDEYVLSIGSDWIKSGEYYYYKNVVTPENPTTNLINSCQLAPNVTAPKGYGLCVEIVADAVQADGVNNKGEKPVVLAWDVDPSTLQ